MAASLGIRWPVFVWILEMSFTWKARENQEKCDNNHEKMQKNVKEGKKKLYQVSKIHIMVV